MVPFGASPCRARPGAAHLLMLDVSSLILHSISTCRRSQVVSPSMHEKDFPSLPGDAFLGFGLCRAGPSPPSSPPPSPRWSLKPRGRNSTGRPFGPTFCFSAAPLSHAPIVLVGLDGRVYFSQYEHAGSPTD